MSGELVGIGIAGQMISVTAATAVAGAIAVVAGTCLVAGAGAYALAVVGRGAIRLGKNTYTAIDEQIKEHVAREMIRHQESLRQHFATSTQNFGETLVVPVAAPATPPFKVNCDNPFDELEKTIKAREAKEKEYKLPTAVSKEMKEDLEKMQKMIRDLHQSTKTSSAGTLQKKEVDQPLRDNILALADSIKSLYPGLADTARKKALNPSISANTLRKEIISLLEKENTIKQYANICNELIEIKMRFDTDPIIEISLSKGDKARFNKEFDSVRNQIESSGAGDITGLEQLRAALAAQARTLHDQKMFDDGVALFQVAMENAGYTVGRIKSADGAALILDGRDNQGVRTRITLGTPAANPDGEPRMKMEVDMAEKLTGADGEGKRCDEAMKRLQREIDSVGLQVRIEDRTLRRAGKLLEGKAENTITAVLAELGVNHVNVTIQGENGVDVNGSRFHFASSDSVQVIAAQIKAGLESGKTGPVPQLPEEQKLREKE